MPPYGQSLSEEREEGDRNGEERSKSNTDSKVIALGGGGHGNILPLREIASQWLAGWLAGCTV